MIMSFAPLDLLKDKISASSATNWETSISMSLNLKDVHDDQRDFFSLVILTNLDDFGQYWSK